MGRQNYDFHLHGLVGIRLVEAAPHDVQTVARTLGPFEASLAGDPDLVIRFVDRIPAASPVRYVIMGRSGYTDDAFLVLQHRRGVTFNTRIPFDRLGQPCEILCESGGPDVPLLQSMIDLAALARQAVPLHASAFMMGDTGVLMAGFPSGGKTSGLLAFTARGARYISDDWVWLHNGQMVGIPARITIRDWQLDHLPEYRRLVNSSDRLRLQAFRAIQASANALPRRVRTARGIDTWVEKLNGHRHVEMSPRRLFGESLGTLSGQLDRVFLILSHASPDIVVAPLSPEDCLRRLVLIQQREWAADFMPYYHGYQFAFPGRANPFIGQVESVQQALLRQALAEKPAFVVYHPHPVALDALFEAIVPFVTA